MNEPIILSGFTNSDLVDLQYHIDAEDFKNSFIEIVAQDRIGNKRKLRFWQVSGLQIDKGFFGGLSGMIVVDIKSRQWSGSSIEVQNFEQDSGITFLANRMEIVLDEFNT